MSEKTTGDNTGSDENEPLRPFDEAAIEVLSENLEKPLPAALYHYTSTQGLMGILDSNCIWMTDAAYLNDPTEVAYGVAELNKAFRSFVNGKDERETNFISKVVEEAADQKLEYRVAVFCASESDDLLNQWRDYGKEEVAYCVGFDWRQMLDRDRETQNGNFRLGVARMIYDGGYQLELCGRIIQKIFDLRADPSFDPKGHSQKDITMFAGVQILEVLRSFKNPAFAAEQEIRLMDEVNSIVTHHHEESCFRPSSLGVTPYFKWRCSQPSGLLPITSVRVGPCRHPFEAEEATKNLLKAHGYANVTVSASTAPTR